MRNRKGYTLIEVLIAMLIIIIATTSILIVLGKLVNMAGQQPGASIDITRATAIAQEQLDAYKYCRPGVEFPTVNGFTGEPLENVPLTSLYLPENSDFTPGFFPGQDYSYEVNIGAWDAITGRITQINDIDGDLFKDPATESEYIDSTDNLLAGNIERNIFRITVRVYQGRAADPNRRLIVTASTYKVRNGYF